MTPREIALIQESFAKVAPIKQQAARLFYGRLFELAPEVQPLFKGDLETQGNKLMATLAVAVNGLDDLGSVVPVVEELARRHVTYGVRAEHYQPVGEALLWTLGQGLGEACSDEVEAAWAKAYGLLSSTMIAAAYPAPAGA
jgi:nitric oxide dioxygenase